MIRPGVKITGEKEVEDALKFFLKDVLASTKSAVQATALEALTDVRRAIQEPPKTGVIYTKANGIKHQASKAGEAPATDDGTLVGSTYYTMIDNLTAAIGSRLDYAFVLEFGWRPDKEGTKRPSWVPAAERAAPKLTKRLNHIIKKAKAQAEKKTR
jgi:hypothetical protein